MKKQFFLFAVLILSVVALFAFGKMQSGVTGKVTPAAGVEFVYVVSGVDTAYGTINEGVFGIAAKPGTYTLHVKAKEPYKSVAVENVQVTEGQNTDVGEIVLTEE